ncbi:hypothetical protein [Hydrogenimonas cancrithermarum]|uniref:Uncharacterized protein n=1 Tax=Hydrogenimonas cancrithermarum TaxID=2993563 RepID=A0ABM8FIT0_9BACT|nr:hypothetical protein [Hydrogenimonas cancrithermarum]BDY12177.1 hypothetical protein HCR_04890 [Hydrogenimonas cancrithermarum]
MPKSILAIFLLNLSLFAGMLSFDHIETTLLLKKERTPVNVEISLVLQGRDIEENEIQLMDVVQTAVGSFWAETLVTSSGKEQFKKMIIDLADKKYGIEVDFVYLQNIKIETCTLEKIRQILNNARR